MRVGGRAILGALRADGVAACPLLHFLHIDPVDPGRVETKDPCPQGIGHRGIIVRLLQGFRNLERSKGLDLILR